MNHQVLGIGFLPAEFSEMQNELAKNSADIEFSESSEHARSLLQSNEYTCVIFHSRILDCMIYIDIIRVITSTPVLILTPEYTNAEQAQSALQYLLNADGKNKIKVSSPLSAFTYGDLYFCQEQRIVRIQEHVVDLTAKEFDILSLLISNPNRVFTYEMIIELVWNEDFTFSSRKTVSNHVGNLRRKLKVTQNTPDYIKSVHGVGYKFAG